MKTLLSALVLLTSVGAQAQLFSTRSSYLHHETNARIELSRIDQESQTAQFYDHVDGKYKTVSLGDISKETNKAINGVKVGDMILARFSDTKHRACEVYYLYTNGMAHIGCQTGKYTESRPVPRPIIGTYTASTEGVIQEVSALDGFEKKDKVRLMADVGDLKKGDLVRIEHIFKSGNAMVQKMGANLIDTSGLLLKSRVQVVELRDLAINK